MERSNSYRPFRKVGSIRKRFEKKTENQQLQNIRRQRSYIPVCSDIVKNRKLHFEEQLFTQNRTLGYNKSKHSNSCSNGYERTPAPVNIDSSFEQNSTSQFKNLLIPDVNSHNININTYTNQGLFDNDESNIHSIYEPSPRSSEEFMADTNFTPPRLKSEPFHEVKTNTFNTAPIIRYAIPKKVINSKSTRAYSSGASICRNEDSRNINVPTGDYNQIHYDENSNNVVPKLIAPSKPSIDIGPAETSYIDSNTLYVSNEDINMYNSYSQPVNNGEWIFHSQSSKLGGSSTSSKLPPKPLTKASHPDSDTHFIYKEAPISANTHRIDYNQKHKNDRNNTFNTLPKTRSPSNNTTLNLERDKLVFLDNSTDHIYNDKFQNSTMHSGYNPVARDGCPISEFNTHNAENITAKKYEYNKETDNEKRSTVSSNSGSSDELLRELKRNILKTRPTSDFPLYIKISDDKIEYFGSNVGIENTNNLFQSTIEPVIETAKDVGSNALYTLSRGQSSVPNIYHPKENNERQVKPESQQAMRTHSNNEQNDYYTIDNHSSTENGKPFKHNILDFAKKYVGILDSENDDFGAHSNTDTDFCYETFNNGNENVLFKIWIDRDLITNDYENYEDDIMLINDYIHYNNTIEEITNERDREIKNSGCTSHASNIGNEGEFSCHNENQNPYDIIENIRNKPELEVKDAKRTSNVSKVGTDKNFELELVFQNEDCTDGNNVWRNSNYFNSSVEQYNVIRELIDTEQTYIKNMLYIIVNYLHVFRRDPYISSDIEIVFGNIEQIYKETKRILSNVKECTSVEEIAKVFLTSVHVFELYIEYMRNKSKSYRYSTKTFSKLLKNRQRELNDHHTCEDYLVNPVQRLARYGLLLRKLSNTLSKSKQTCKALDEAIALIEMKIFEGNTKMTIDSIRHCPMNLRRLKRYLMKDVFYVNRKYNNSLFLFEGGVVFCKESQNNIDQYEFLECIEMNELSLKHSSNSTSFHLGYYNKSKKYVDENKYEFYIEARSMTIKEDWVNEIQRLLWRQLQYFKDLQNATRNRKDIAKEEMNCEGAQMADENEYHVMEGALYKEYNNKTCTYFDKDRNTRIEITTHSEELETNNNNECTSPSEEKKCDVNDNIHVEDEASGVQYENTKTRIKHKIPDSKNFLMYNISEGQSNAIKQIITNEENYLNEMQEIMNNNWLDSEDPNFCPYIQILMENINSIYQKGYKMYLELLKCDTVDAFSQIFLDNISLFDLYIKFIYNKLTFCRYTIHKRIEMGHHHTFDEYIVNGVVRLHRYKSHLDLLDKELKNSDELCAILKDVIALLNDKMSTLKRILTINSIQRCPINLDNMGSFVMMEMFHIKGNGETMVFLFDRIIILTIGGVHEDTYIYVDSIEIANLSISSSGTKNLKLRSKENKPESAKKKYDLEAISDEKRQIWKNRLEKLLKTL